MPRHRLVINNRAGVRISSAWLQAILQEVAKKYGPKRATETSLAFVADSSMANLNRIYHGEAGPTDVLSFSYLRHQPVQVGQPFFTGEVIIAPRRAARSAKRFGHSLQTEIGLLFMHGLLHVFEFDHEKGSREKQRMAKAEEALIKSIPGLKRANRTGGLIVRELVHPT